MTLGDSKIKEIMGSRIKPFNPDQVGPSSYDCRLGTGMKVIESGPGFITIPQVDPVKYKDVEMVNGYYALFPGQFALVTTEEWVEMPGDIDAHVDGRSSIGRLGLMVHITAGYIDPGFHGQITLELYNATNSLVMLKPGVRICQLVFTKVDGCEKPYDKRSGSKYNGQEGPTGSKLEYEEAQVERPMACHGFEEVYPDCLVIDGGGNCQNYEGGEDGVCKHWRVIE